ncbi:MAG: hypothetical protein ACPIOQ_18880, partial [Promethearchaeia archaeon]
VVWELVQRISQMLAKLLAGDGCPVTHILKRPVLKIVQRSLNVSHGLALLVVLYLTSQHGLVLLDLAQLLLLLLC